MDSLRELSSITLLDVISEATSSTEAEDVALSSETLDVSLKSLVSTLSTCSISDVSELSSTDSTSEDCIFNKFLI